MQKVRIVTDSAGDIPLDICEKLNIGVIPAFLNFGEESYPDDGQAITREEYYTRLAQTEELPTTSAPPPGLGEKVFREALEAAEHVVAISVASNLSSIHDGMVLAANQVSTDRITILDSGTLSMGEGWMAIRSAEAAADGASVEDIKQIMSDFQKRTRVWATLETLEFLRRSGRVSWVRASISAVLNIKPVIAAWDSEVRQETRVRTMDKAIKQLVALAREQAPLERLAVMHASAEENAEKIKTALADVAPEGQTLIVPATPVIGTHVGPGALGVAVVRKA